MRPASELKQAERLLSDFPYFAEHNLKIKPKTGPYIPFTLNRAQVYLHERIEDQKKRTGRVRIIIVKGRQQGCSTYVGGRYYWQTSTKHALLTFIFAHDADASNSLFQMVNDYYEYADTSFRPVLGKSNAKELLFPVLKSGYKVGTAGTKGLGRSKTFQRVHWSEVAYSPNSDQHAAGILQTVADAEETEIILESTANGEGDFFHRQAMQALANEGEGYELIFIPWYWQDEYTKEIKGEFALEQPTANQEFTSEQEYFDMFKDDGLTLEHLNWRRSKIKDDFQGDIVQFMREYPFYVEEAFEASSEESYIKPLLVRKARRQPIVNTNAPLVFGVDPARLGGDAFKICHRKGRNVTKLYSLKPGRVDQTAERLIQEINKYQPAKVFIDAGGLGVGVYDILVGKGYGQVVVKVDMGEQSLQPDKNRNKRAELYRSAKTWLEDSPVSIQLPKKEGDKLQTELSLGKAMWFHNSQLQIEPKENIKKELGYSPDTADSFILTFAGTVNPEAIDLNRRNMGKPMVAKMEFNPFA